METKNQTLPNKQEKKSTNKFCIIIISFLSLLSCLIGWQYWVERNRSNKEVIIKEQVIVERDNVKTDLLELQQDYATLQTNDKALQGELEEKKAYIAELIIQAEKHKNDSYFISKLKKEGETLRQIMRGYIVTIDSLNTLNKTLIVEKDQVKADLNAEKNKSSKLSKEKEDLQGVVSLASVLQTTQTDVSGVRFKSGGKKEIKTTKANKTEKIKVTFTLGENKIAKKGNRDIYVRVITPDGKELAKAADEENMFEFNGVRGFFSAKQRINYDNQKTAVSMYCEGKDGFVPGKYIIEIYSDQANIGQTSLNLE